MGSGRSRCAVRGDNRASAVRPTRAMGRDTARNATSDTQPRGSQSHYFYKPICASGLRKPSLNALNASLAVKNAVDRTHTRKTQPLGHCRQESAAATVVTGGRAFASDQGTPGQRRACWATRSIAASGNAGSGRSGRGTALVMRLPRLSISDPKQIVRRLLKLVA